VKVPNAKSRRAMKELAEGKGRRSSSLQRYPRIWASEVLGPVVEPFKRDVRRAESQGAQAQSSTSGRCSGCRLMSGLW
jgi:hypothetical protein